MSDANRPLRQSDSAASPCPEPLDWKWIENVLACNCANEERQVCDKCQLLALIRRLAQAQREAVAGAYEDAAQVCQKLFSDQIENCNIACHATCAVHIKERTPADAQNALELTRVRAAQEEAKKWHDELIAHEAGSDFCKTAMSWECGRYNVINARKMELERGLEMT